VKVILIENIDRLGNIGDIVDVKDGYARNYLLPNNKAKTATPANMKILDALKKKRAAEDAKILAEAKMRAAKLEELSITIAAQAGEEEKLFGSVTADMIAQALGAEGVTIDKKDIILNEAIKKLGVYQVAVKVHPDVKANLRVWIVNKAAEPA
jgi:large subunit ribosomal protein L9